MKSRSGRSHRSSSPGRRFDDLTEIKGVGEALERWFKESFDAHSFTELAALSAGEIEARAKEEGVILSREKIRQILAQAKKIAKESEHALPGSGSPVKAQADKNQAPPKKENGWEELASFKVYFESKVVEGKEEMRTTVKRHTAIQHMGTVEQASWPGVEAEPACRWMLDRVSVGFVHHKSLESDASGKAVARQEGAPAGASVDWQIARVRLLLPGPREAVATLYERGQCRPASIASLAPFVAEFLLERTSRADMTAAPQPLQGVRLRARNRDTGTTVDLGQALVAARNRGEPTLALHLHVMPLTSTGSYRLECIPVVDETELASAAVRIPVLQVL